MQEIKDILKAHGCTRDEIEVAVQAITNINGDHIEVYRHINALCKASDELSHTRSLISQLGITQTPAKRPYVRKSKLADESLLSKSGVAAAHEALQEQRPQPGDAIEVPAPKKRQVRKRESDAEIKANVGDLGQVVLTPEEAAANLTIDL